MESAAPFSATKAKASPRAMTRPLGWLVPAIVTGGLIPLASLLYLAWTNALGANPVTEALNRLGLLALILLILSLACTPLKTLFGWTWPIRIRKTLGLLAFFYASLHFLTYAGLDQVLNWRAIFEDITKRKFIAVGFIALVLLVPLAVTSTSKMVKRLGFVRWKRLHRLAYVVVLLGVVHFVWRVKKDRTEPLIYGGVAAALLALRLIPDRKKQAGAGTKRAKEAL